MNPYRRLRLRHLVFATTALAGLATVPTQGADTHLERPKPRVEMAGAERWRLRPAQAVLPAPAVTGSLRGRPATAIPEERRNVRTVYPALVEMR